MRTRDRVAVWLCNVILNTLATSRYRDQIDGSIRYGLNAAARDERMNLSPPRPWWEELTEEDLAIIREDHD